MNKSKAKGNGFERELVKSFIEAGLDAKRAWGSNGEALGFDKEVDVIIKTPKGRQWKAQCKRRANLPKCFLAHLLFNNLVDVNIFRADHENAVVVISLSQFIEFMKNYDNI